MFFNSLPRFLTLFRSLSRWMQSPAQVNGYYSPQQNRIGELPLEQFLMRCLKNIIELKVETSKLPEAR